MLLVQKFGGSSLANPQLVRHAADVVATARRRGDRVVVVVSAMGDATDDLLDLAAAVHAQPPAREVDQLLATGEQVSAALLAIALDYQGCPAVSLTGGQAGIRTDGLHRRASILGVSAQRVARELEAGRVAVVTGFQGIRGEETTTLGRGGSDATAVALAAALAADACEIYSDVAGVYTADPRVVPTARKLPAVAYEEMLELASLGARVLQARAVEYAWRHWVVIHARGTFTSEEGTLVRNLASEVDRVATAVTCDTNVAKIGLVGVPDRPGVAYQLFSALADHHINVDMIIQSVARDGHNDIAFTVTRDDLAVARQVAAAVAADLGAEGTIWDEGVAKVSLVGIGMASHAGVAARMFQALAAERINIDMISTSEIKISCLVAAGRAHDALRAIHDALDLSRP